jgi:hypothetical protein
VMGERPSATNKRRMGTLYNTRVRYTSRNANCITGNVTEGSIVASGKMLLSDRRKILLEERHDEPEKQA